jgi:hypothetical protein
MNEMNNPPGFHRPLPPTPSPGMEGEKYIVIGTLSQGRGILLSVILKIFTAVLAEAGLFLY